MKLYTSKEIQEITEVTEIQLSEWIKSGAIEPFDDKSRDGGIFMFDIENLIDINLSKILSDLRLPNHVISSSIKQLHRFGSSKYRMGYTKNTGKRKSFWDQYLRTYETKQWFFVIINKQKSSETGKLDNIFLNAYKEIGVMLPNDEKDIFLAFPVSKEKLLSVLEYAHLAIVLRLDEIVNTVLDKFPSEELLFHQSVA